MSRRLLVVLAVAGAAATATAIALVVLGHGFDFRPGGLAQGVVTDVIGGIWIATGLIAWQRRPDNLVGPLMTVHRIPRRRPRPVLGRGAAVHDRLASSPACSSRCSCTCSSSFPMAG